MTLSRPARIALAVVMALGLAFVYVPLLYVLLNSFNTSRTFSWPPAGFTLDWWRAAFSDAGVRDAVRASVLVGLGATGLTFYDDDVVKSFSPHAQGKDAIFVVAIGKSRGLKGRE